MKSSEICCIEALECRRHLSVSTLSAHEAHLAHLAHLRHVRHVQHVNHVQTLAARARRLGVDTVTASFIASRGTTATPTFSTTPTAANPAQ